MKKKLDIATVANELRGGSAFFPEYNKSASAEHSSQLPSNDQEAFKPATEASKVVEVIPRNHDTKIPRYRDTMTPAEATNSFEIIRRAVKQFGKEAATYRFTAQEKSDLRDIEYTYERQGIKTSGNEITRISINFIIDDYKTNGEQSILAKILLSYIVDIMTPWYHGIMIS